MKFVNTERCKYQNVINHTIYCALNVKDGKIGGCFLDCYYKYAQSEQDQRISTEKKLFDAVSDACLLKNLFGQVEKLIQKAVDPEKTKNMYESLDCLYDALDICKKVREHRRN